MRLTIKEENVLNKVARKARCDCWFRLEASGSGEYYVNDIENGVDLDLRDGVNQLMEALDCEENYYSCDLNNAEEATLEALLEKLELPMIEDYIMGV